MKFLSYIYDVFWEKKCFWCQESGHFFCLLCNKNLVLYKPYCYVCKKKSHDFYVHKECQKYFPIDKVIVLTRYRNPWIKKLLRHAKFYSKYRAYQDIISKNVDFFKTHITSKNSILVPVPMHFFRRWKRGYNQSEKIAQILWDICDIPVNNKFIKRRRYTSQQSHLSEKMRKNNLSWAFKIHKATVNKNTTIYIVDDVISTGSTVLELVRLLRENGFKKIEVICVASD